MNSLFKKITAMMVVLSIAAIFTSCVSKDTYNPNYVLYTSPFGEDLPEQDTEADSGASEENLNEGNGEDSTPDSGGGADYDTGNNSGDSNSGGSNNSGGNNNSGRNSGNNNSNSSANKTPTTTAAKKKTPAASPTKKSSGGSSGTSLDGILGAIGGGGSDNEIIGGAVKTITDMIDVIKNGGLSGGSGGSSNTLDPVTVNMNLSQAMDIYNSALTKAYSSKPSLEKIGSAQVLDYESDNPLWHIGGQVAAKFVNDTVKSEAEQTPIWPERGSVEESLFKIKLDSGNTRGMYAKPQQSGDIIFFDFGVADTNVQYPMESKNLTPSSIVDTVAKSLQGVSGRDVSASIEWTRIICAIDRSNDRFVSLQHDFILKITIAGSTSWPEPSYFRLMMSQGYENFKY